MASEGRVPERPLAPLIVASWYPSVEDTSKGRFVADQAVAVRATGRAVPSVASFELVRIRADDPAEQGWEARAVWELLPAALDRDDVFSPSGWSAPGVPVARLPVPLPIVSLREPGTEGDAKARSLSALEDVFRAGRAPVPDLIHAHTGYPDGYAGMRLARALGIPLVITEHASFVDRQLEEPEERRRYLEAASYASHVVAVSHSLADRLVDALPELAAKLLVIPNAVPLEAFALPRSEVADELLYVGARTEEKGLPELLEAFALVHGRRPGLSLRLIGGSRSEADERRWRALVAEYGVEEAVRFEGHADRADVAAAMSRAALFVHPSRSETFGVVAVEALAAGLPVVAADSGGVTETLRDCPAPSWRVVPVRAPQALADGILELLERRHEVDAEALREYAATRYAPGVIGTRLAELYERVTERQQPREQPGEQSLPDQPPPAPSRAPTILVSLEQAGARRLADELPTALLSSVEVVTAQPWRPTTDVQAALAPRLIAVPRLASREDQAHLDDRVAARAAQAEAAGESLIYLLQEYAYDELGVTSTAGGVPPEERPHLVCLYALDFAACRAAMPEIATLTRLAPGGIRWVADRWETSRQAEREVRRRASGPERQPSATG